MKNLFIVILGLMLSHTVIAQTTAIDDSILNAAVDELINIDNADLYDLFDGNTKYHFLYFGSMFNTSTFYAGNELIDVSSGESIVNTSAQLYYFISNGLYFGASGAWYSHIDPGFRTVLVSLGYTSDIPNVDFLRYRFSYDRFIYLNMGADYEPNFSNDFNVGLTFKHKNIGTRLDYTLLTGRDSLSSQFSWDIYTRIKLFDLGGYDKIQFKPEVSAFFSTEMYDYQINPEVNDDPFGEQIYEQRTNFGLLNLRMVLPLSIAYKDFDFEVAFIYNLPNTLDPEQYYMLDKEYYDGENTIFNNNYYFRFSLGYILRIK